MRITIVEDSGDLGGGQMALARYLLCGSEHDTTVVSVRSGPAWEAIRGVDRESVQVLGGPAGRMRTVARVPHLWLAVRRSAPDLVVSNSLRASMLLSVTPKVRGARYVHYLHESVDRQWLGAAKAVFVNRRVLPYFDSFVACSQWCLRSLSSQFSSVPRLVVYTLSGVSGPVDRSRPVYSTTPLRLVYVGRIAEWKRLDLILEALRLIEDREGPNCGFELKIAGDASYGDSVYADQVRRKAARLTTPVDFLGYVADPLQLLAGEDVMIVASQPPEPFGQVVVQGLAAGVCVVTPDAGGPVEILGAGRFGVTFKDGDPNDLASVLVDLRSSPERVRCLGAAGADRVEAFSDEVVAAGLDAAWSMLGDMGG